MVLATSGWVARSLGEKQYHRHYREVQSALDNLATGITISSNMDKEHVRVGCCQGSDARFVFLPE